MPKKSHSNHKQIEAAAWKWWPNIVYVGLNSITFCSQKVCLHFETILWLSQNQVSLPLYSRVGFRRTQGLEPQPAGVLIFQNLAILFLFRTPNERDVRTFEETSTRTNTHDINWNYAVVAENATFWTFCKPNFGTIFGKVLVIFRPVRCLRCLRYLLAF